MIQSVEDFLNETKVSSKQFDRLVQFFHFKDSISYKQHFKDAFSEIATFFQENFNVKNIKITSYDIEYAKDTELFHLGEAFNEITDTCIFSFDFSRSYALNGRIFFQVENQEQLNKVYEDQNYLDFIFYELRDILSSHLAIEKLRDSTLIDDVTQLPNRRFLLTHLSTLLPVMKKENLKMALLKIDIDRFKSILEEFNYAISNKVLKKLASTLNNYTTDTELLVRFEGNTFLICMEDIKDDNEASNLAIQCIESFAKHFVVVDSRTQQKLYKTISVGITIYPTDGTNLDELFRNCDIALDEAKNKGRSSYEFFQRDNSACIDFF